MRGLGRTALAAALIAVLVPASAVAAPAGLWQVPESGPANGTGAGELSTPRWEWRSINQAATSTSPTSSNSRVDEFTAWGVFVKAFGWNVDAGAPAEEAQTCSAESGCQAGSKGAGAGQFDRPEGLAVDSAGNVYVVDLNNHRVQKFDSEGNFVLMFGGEVDKDSGENLCTAASGDECGIGTLGTADGQFAQWPTLFGKAHRKRHGGHRKAE